MKKQMSKLTKLLLVATMIVATSVASFAGVVSANSKVKGKVVINGSSALLPVLLAAAKEFKRVNPGITVAVSGSASIAGPQALEKGTATIGSCDWDSSKAVPGFSAFSGQVPHLINIIPFATIVNPNVTVDNLTTKQLQDIFSGKITNWKEVGGQDAEIIVVNRSFGSGTRVNYQITALKGEPFMSSGKNLKEVLSNGVMTTTVRTTPNAIGYTDLVYVKSGLKALKYNGVEPTIPNVINGTYPVEGFGYLMTKGQPGPAEKAFIDYVLSPKFQKGTLTKMKFIPVIK